MTFAEKRMARDYSHAVISFRHCGFWWCLRCHWWRLIGKHELERLRSLLHTNEVLHLIPKVKMRRNAEGRWVQVEGDA